MPYKNDEDKQAWGKAYYQRNKERKNAQSKAWTEANRDKARASVNSHYRRNTDKLLAAGRARYALNPLKASNRHKAVRYKLTQSGYDAKLAEQGGLCACCSKKLTPGRLTHIDHDHACCSGVKTCGMCVRGLLCNRCNTRLSVVEDSEFLALARQYLSKYLAFPISPT